MHSLVELTDDQFDSGTGTGLSGGPEFAWRDGKRTLLSNRLRQRIRALGYTDFATYLNLLNSTAGRDEFPEFINAITTNETFFFRNPEQYDWLRSEFLQEVVRRGRPGPSGENPADLVGSVQHGRGTVFHRHQSAGESTQAQRVGP